MAKLKLFGAVGGEFSWDTWQVEGILTADVQAFFEEIDENEPVEIVISSFGGDLATGLEIRSIIKNHKGPTTTRYISMNASAATVIGSASDEILIEEDGLLLIHRASSFVGVYGSMNEDELEQVIEDLKGQKRDHEAFNKVLAGIYQKISGKSMEEVMSLMKEDRWLTADEAVEFGLAEKSIETSTEGAELTAKSVKLVASKQGKVPPLPKTSKHLNQIKMTADEIKDFVKNTVESAISAFKGKDDAPKNVTVSISDEEAVTAKLTELSNSKTEAEQRAVEAEGKIEALEAKQTELEDEINRLKGTPNNGGSNPADPDGIKQPQNAVAEALVTNLSKRMK